MKKGNFIQRKNYENDFEFLHIQMKKCNYDEYSKEFDDILYKVITALVYKNTNDLNETLNLKVDTEDCPSGIYLKIKEYLQKHGQKKEYNSWLKKNNVNGCEGCYGWLVASTKNFMKDKIGKHLTGKRNYKLIGSNVVVNKKGEVIDLLDNSEDNTNLEKAYLSKELQEAISLLEDWQQASLLKEMTYKEIAEKYSTKEKPLTESKIKSFNYHWREKNSVNFVA